MKVPPLRTISTYFLRIDWELRGYPPTPSCLGDLHHLKPHCGRLEVGYLKDGGRGGGRGGAKEGERVGRMREGIERKGGGVPEKER